jgi:protein-tyrosine phosphatase
MLIVGAVRGERKEALLGERYTAVPGYWDEYPLVDEIDEIALGSYKVKQPPEITGTGFVVKSLEAALWAFYTTDDFREGCLRAVNLGNDADTTGAVYGQLAGAYYGKDGIPVGWREKIAHRSLIESFSQGLLDLADSVKSPTPVPPPVPHPLTYWVEPGSLLAGFYPGDLSATQARAKLRALLLAGVDSFIDLTEDDELYPYNELLVEEANEVGVTIEHKRFAIRDQGVPSPHEMRNVLDAIAGDLQIGKTVYVHCWGGIGRTGTVVGCHLVERGRTGQEALETIRALRSSVPDLRLSPETKAQRQMVINWA